MTSVLREVLEAHRMAWLGPEPTPPQRSIDLALLEEPLFVPIRVEIPTIARDMGVAPTRHTYGRVVQSGPQVAGGTAIVACTDPLRAESLSARYEVFAPGELFSRLADHSDGIGLVVDPDDLNFYVPDEIVDRLSMRIVSGEDPSVPVFAPGSELRAAALNGTEAALLRAVLRVSRHIDAVYPVAVRGADDWRSLLVLRPTDGSDANAVTTEFAATARDYLFATNLVDRRINALFGNRELVQQLDGAVRPIAVERSFGR